MEHPTFLRVVKIDNLINIDSHKIANNDNYDYFISTTVKESHLFTSELLKHFHISDAVAFVGLNDAIPLGLPISVFQKHISNVRSKDAVNLDFYTTFFKNIFLRMDVKGYEVSWLNYISEEKLNRIKQIVITLDPVINEIGLKKLNNTHVPVNVDFKNNNKLVITYLRKDMISDSVVQSSLSDVSLSVVSLSEETKVFADEPISNENVSNEITLVVEEIIPEEPTTVIEEVRVIEEEPIVRNLSFNIPILLPELNEKTTIHCTFSMRNDSKEPIVVESVSEEPVSQEPTTVVEKVHVFSKNPLSEEPVTEEPVSDEPISEEPVSEEPVSEESLSEALVSEEPVSEEAIVAEEPAAEQNILEESIVAE
ncbi:MAG: hypothetical protein EBY20_03000, partial [Alphaproteobacteria bacterium]|nr:hypothetical protein [Alphaproteobacteria bacterium]